MATRRKPGSRYQPGQVVWFKPSEYSSELLRGVITSKPLKYENKMHVEVLYPEREKDKVIKVTAFVPIENLSAPMEMDEVVTLPTAKEKIMKKLKEFRMKKLTTPAIVTGVIIAFIAVIGLWGVANYNSLVTAKNAVDNSKSKIDTELTRRYDLLDNIVQSVQGSQAQEADVFGKIAEARKIGGQSTDSTSEQSQEANQTIDTQIALLPRLQEAYPELRSNDQVTRLITELQGTNNTIRDTRNTYNDTVTNYNNNITRFPKSIFAAIFNYDKAKLFEATTQERTNPKVELDREQN
jgi:LemA protein